MAHDGEVDVLRTQDSESHYRRCHRQEQHHHLVRRLCGHAVEVAEAQWNAGLGASRVNTASPLSPTRSNSSESARAAKASSGADSGCSNRMGTGM
ncbi:hypothetical protein R5O87_14620 [Arthrobacter globiformis]|uniref:hypothetical protein n=1 Tax=Arthrobacter globiformis TaxID=1665 RepID=UPI00397E7741